MAPAAPAPQPQAQQLDLPWVPWSSGRAEEMGGGHLSSEPESLDGRPMRGPLSPPRPPRFQHNDPLSFPNRMNHLQVHSGLSLHSAQRPIQGPLLSSRADGRGILETGAPPSEQPVALGQAPTPSMPAPDQEAGRPGLVPQP